MTKHASQAFGLSLDAESTQQIATVLLQQRVDDGVPPVATPTIDHIATIRHSPALAQAYKNAARIVSDGWPMQMDARLCGLHVFRVTQS